MFHNIIHVSGLHELEFELVRRLVAGAENVAFWGWKMIVFWNILYKYSIENSISINNKNVPLWTYTTWNP